MQWIKVFTNIFANPKIQLLLKERDGDTFFRVWIQLLTLAGISMQDGRIMMSENTTITVENLATITHKSTKKIQNILNKLIHFEMIIFEDNIYRIKNWDKYQSADKYEIIKQQNRERQKRFRETQKDGNNVNVTLGNDGEKNKKENNKLENNKKDFSRKKGYLDYEQREYPPEFFEVLYDNLRKWGKYEGI